MKLELKINVDNPGELLRISAKLRDLESLRKDALPFFPDDPVIEETPEEQALSGPEALTPTQDEMTNALRRFASEKGTEALLNILHQFGVMRFTELPEDRWADVLTEIEKFCIGE